MDNKLSILICTVAKRSHMLKSLHDKLERQISKFQINGVEIIIDKDEYSTVGYKRNKLMSAATGEYSAFIDDDDDVPNDYLVNIYKGLETSPDCCSLKGIITTNGFDARTFIHSIKYDHYFEEDGIYYRPPNHLNTIKSSIGKQFIFPDNNFGEDTDWAMQVCRSGMLRTESWIEPTLYYYKFVNNK